MFILNKVLSINKTLWGRMLSFRCSQRQFSAGSYDSVDINDFLFEDDDSEPSSVCSILISHYQVENK